MHSAIRLLILAGVVAAWTMAEVAASTSSVPLYPQASPIQLTAVADTWGWTTVLPITPPAPMNHGSEPELVTAVDDTRGIAPAYVRFDLSSLPAGVAIASARLELLTGSATDPRPVHISRVHLVTEAWDEATLTDEHLARIDVEHFVETKPVQGEWASWDITHLVRGWLAGVPNYGLALTTATGLYFRQAFASRESGNAPRLIVVLGEPPDATTTPVTGTATRTPATPTAPVPLPDLEGWTREGCGPLSLVVVNNGLAEAGAFTVEPLGWRIPGLTARQSVSRRLDAIPREPIVIDVADEVHESNERNNRASSLFVTCSRPKLLLPAVYVTGRPQPRINRAVPRVAKASPTGLLRYH